MRVCVARSSQTPHYRRQRWQYHSFLFVDSPRHLRSSLTRRQRHFHYSRKAEFPSSGAPEHRRGGLSSKTAISDSVHCDFHLKCCHRIVLMKPRRIYSFFLCARVAHNSARASCALFSLRKSSSIIQFSSFFLLFFVAVCFVFDFFFLLLSSLLSLFMADCVASVVIIYLMTTEKKKKRKYASLTRTQLATVKMLTLENLALIKTEVIMTTAIVSFSADCRLIL